MCVNLQSRGLWQAGISPSSSRRFRKRVSRSLMRSLGVMGGEEEELVSE